MAEILDFINAQPGALTLLILAAVGYNTLEIRNLKGWVRDLHGHIHGKE